MISKHWVLFILSVLAILAVLFWIPNLLVSSLLGFVFFFLMNPLVEKMQQRGISRLWGTTLIFSITTLAIIILFILIFPPLSEQFQRLQTEWPHYAETSQVTVQKILNFLDDYAPLETIYKVLGQVQGSLTQVAEKLFRDVPQYISSSLTVLFLAPFLTFFMLLDGPDFIKQLLQLSPRQQIPLFGRILNELARQMGGFVRARLLESAFISLVIWMGLLIMGFPYALILSIFAGLMNLIPYLGPLIGMIPAYLIGMSVGIESSGYWWITFIYVLAQVIDTVVIVPFLVARIVNLHPVIVVISVMIGAQLMGILGMIISIPVSSAIKVILEALFSAPTSQTRLVDNSQPEGLDG